MFPFPLMILAAGFGTRMGALTADRPKPLIPVAGRALIDHALDVATAAGAARVVVNTHYRADQLAAHLAARPVVISHESAILETGGGLKAALPLLGPGPVAVLNSDAIWTGANPLAELAAVWDGSRMETLLLLSPAAKGDFRLGPDMRISRGPRDGRRDGAGDRDHRYLGACILRPERVLAVTDAVFSLNLPWDGMIAAGTAFGTLHRGGWCDVGHPEGIAEAERLLHSARHG